jgi:hypothetical protein
LNNKKLHIVSFDVPYPADYGGAIDVFYRIKALHSLGVNITLHCFEYGRGKQLMLNNYCDKVYYYKRPKKVLDQLSSKPFIVVSRKNPELVKNLCKDDSPILFEGLHTTYFLDDPKLSERIKIVRTHNIEHEYYAELAKQNSGLQKRYLKTEAGKLRKYESILEHADHILAIKSADEEYFRKINRNTNVLPACGEEPTHDKIKTDPYCLFHGNLSVAENETAALWLIDSINDQKIVLAGKNPTDNLIRKASEKGVQLVPNPNTDEMNELIDKARVHLFYSEQATGVKLKLIRSLWSSGHVIANTNMVLGTNLTKTCSIADSPQQFQKLIDKMIKIELTDEEHKARVKFLTENYSNEKNCAQILELI